MIINLPVYLNTASRLRSAQKHIWNIIEEIVYLYCNFFFSFLRQSSIVFQTYFLTNPSQGGLVFEILKIIQNYDQK